MIFQTNRLLVNPQLVGRHEMKNFWLGGAKTGSFIRHQEIGN